MAVITSNGTGGGNWSAGASWSGGVAPVLGTDSAGIANGDTIVIDTTGLGCGTDPGSGVDGLTIQSGGILNYATSANSGLTVRGCITVESGGTLYDGTQLAISYGHELIIDCVDAVNKYGLTIEDGGIFKPYGTLPTTWYTTLASDIASAQANVVTTDDVQTDWGVGDEIAFPPTGDDSRYGETEIRTINSFTDATHFDVTSNFTYAHEYLQHEDCPQTSIVLLTRNVRIKSASTSYPASVRNQSKTTANFDARNVEFKDLNGGSLSIPSLVFSSKAYTDSPAYSYTAYGNIYGCSFHGARAGFLMCLYNNPALITFNNNVICSVGTSSRGFYFEYWSNDYKFDRLFVFGL